MANFIEVKKEKRLSTGSRMDIYLVNLDKVIWVMDYENGRVGIAFENGSTLDVDLHYTSFKASLLIRNE